MARGEELTAPHRANRKRPATQDGRKLRRYKRRRKVERLWAWPRNFRRAATSGSVMEAGWRGYLRSRISYCRLVTPGTGKVLTFASYRNIVRGLRESDYRR